MSFGSNVMPKRFGAGHKKSKTSKTFKTQLKIWEAAAATSKPKK